MFAGRRLCVHCWRTFRLLSAQGRSLATNVFMPATFARLDIAEQAPVVNAFTTNGFIIRGNRVYGSVALLPRGLFHWKVSRVEEMTPESFTLFHLVQPKIDLIVVGTGMKVERINQSITDYLRKKGITLEIQDTPNACATFNFLLEEGRPAGAALIPPEYIPP